MPQRRWLAGLRKLTTLTASITCSLAAGCFAVAPAVAAAIAPVILRLRPRKHGGSDENGDQNYGENTRYHHEHPCSDVCCWQLCTGGRGGRFWACVVSVSAFCATPPFVRTHSRQRSAQNMSPGSQGTAGTKTFGIHAKSLDHTWIHSALTACPTRAQALPPVPACTSAIAWAPHATRSALCPRA